MKQYNKRKNSKIGVVSWTILALISIGLISSAYGQEIEDNLNEDQVIVCINGHIVELFGDICKVFQADIYHDRLISDMQQELYDNPNTDTFNMAVVD